MIFIGFFPSLVIFLGVVFGVDVEKFTRAIRGRDFIEIENIAETDRVDLKSSFVYLHVAVRIGDAAITRLLLSKGWDKVVNNVDRLGKTPLYAICSERNKNKDVAYEIMEALLKAGANTSDLDHFDQNSILGMGPLHMVDDGRTVRLLISYGANVDAKDFMDRTPAHSSFFYKDCGVIKALADGGADFSITDCNGNTILHSCRPEYGFSMTKEIAMLLVQKGAPLEACNQRGETPLTKFLKAEVRMDSLWRLKPSRSDCGECNSSLSYENLNDSFYACILAAGADINRPNGMGESLIHIAVCEFEVDLLKWLLENGAYVDSRNAKGDTPLLVLLKCREPDNSDYDASSLIPVTELVAFIKVVMEVLVNGGADVEATDVNGHNAMHYLQKANFTSIDNEIADLLLKK